VVVNTDGLALGVISRTDLANASFVEPYMRHWRGMTARHLMTSPVISVGAGTPVADALDLLRTRKIHRLVVTEAVPGGERPIGILSLTDVVRHVDPLGGGLRPPSDTSPQGLRGQSPRSRP
ncbi:MAG: CBS domain-containing protein, partial [candidate division NC10 bacterium]